MVFRFANRSDDAIFQKCHLFTVQTITFSWSSEETVPTRSERSVNLIQSLEGIEHVLHDVQMDDHIKNIVIKGLILDVFIS